MRVLLLASHGIAEYDDIRMLHHLGYEVFCPGGYANPAQPGETLRPALPGVPFYPDLAELCEVQRMLHPEPPGRYIDWAKADLHPDLIDWADVIIAHHFVREWIRDQWPRISRKRVIWRTCGQSDPGLEMDMAPLRQQGLQIVRYSPAERRHFERVGAFAGEDAVIRFGKFVEDYRPWIPTGHIVFPSGDDSPYVANVTQHMVARGESVGLSFYLAATKGLPAAPAGPGSKELPNGLGPISYDDLRGDYLPKARAYLYTGTTPASYTLGLIEAMLVGVPVVSITAADWGGPDDLFEGYEIATVFGNDWWTPRARLEAALKPPDEAWLRDWSTMTRRRAVELFGMETVGAQWREFLG